MAKNRDCPVCGSPIMFSYIKPQQNFDIINGEIVQDKNTELWTCKDPYLEFQCTLDITHDLHTTSIVEENIHAQLYWEEAITEEFYEKIFPHL